MADASAGDAPEAGSGDADGGRPATDGGDAGAPVSPPASAAHTLIDAGSAVLVANGTADTFLLITVRDADEDPVVESGHTVCLATTAGTLSSATGQGDCASGEVQAADLGDGTYGATLVASTDASEVATVTGVLDGDAIGDAAVVDFVAGPAAGIDLQTGPDALAGSSVSVTALVTDAHGNPVAGASVVFSIVEGDGSLTAPAARPTDELGRVSIDYTTHGIVETAVVQARLEADEGVSSTVLIASLCADGSSCPAAASACCGGACVDLAVDERHCGACGAACADRILDGSASSCSEGVCQIECGGSGFPLVGAGTAECDGATAVLDCEPGFIDENRDPADGCETEIAELIAAVEMGTDPSFGHCDGWSDPCVVRVSCHPADPSPIQVAVDSLGADGGIVIVSDTGNGPCVGDITIDKNGVWIVADGALPRPTLRGVAVEAGVSFPDLAPGIHVVAHDVVIQGLRIEGPSLQCPDRAACPTAEGEPVPDDTCTGTYHSGIVVDGTGIRIVDNDFFVTTGAGSFAIQSAPSAAAVDGLRVRNNVFTSGDESLCDPDDAEWIECAGCVPPVPDGYEALRLGGQSVAPVDFVMIERNLFAGRVARAVHAARQRVRVRNNLLDGVESQRPTHPAARLPRGVEVVASPPADGALGVTIEGNRIIGFDQGIRVGVQIGSGRALLAPRNCFLGNDAAVSLVVDPHLNGGVDATAGHWDPPGDDGEPRWCGSAETPTGENCIEASTSGHAERVATAGATAACPPLRLPR